MNAVNASATARLNAAPNSTVGLIATYEKALTLGTDVEDEITDAEITAAATALAALSKPGVPEEPVKVLNERLGLDIDPESAVFDQIVERGPRDPGRTAVTLTASCRRPAAGRFSSTGNAVCMEDSLGIARERRPSRTHGLICRDPFITSGPLGERPCMTTASLRVLIVEDETMVSMLIEDMTSDSEQRSSARPRNSNRPWHWRSRTTLDLAILDVNHGWPRGLSRRGHPASSRHPVYLRDRLRSQHRPTRYQHERAPKPFSHETFREAFDTVVAERVGAFALS